MEKIEVLREIPFSELASMVRSVPLSQKGESGEQIFVYQNAEVGLRRSGYQEVNPTTFYVLKEGLERQRLLRRLLIKSFGLDSLMLEGALEIKNDLGEIWTLTPPIIEVTRRTIQYIPQEGEIRYEDPTEIQIPVINDGAHRVFMAREEGLEFNALFISGADERYPFYAHPNSWDEVSVVDDVPSDKRDKKFYSRENCYRLYRDFGVLGCGAPRGTSNG